MIGFLIVVLLVGFVAWRRAAKRRLVAGLVPHRPAFTIEPPPGRLGSRRDKTL